MDLQKWIYGSTEMGLWIYGHQNTWQLIQFVCLSFSCGYRRHGRARGRLRGAGRAASG